jgi:xylulokinase
MGERVAIGLDVGTTSTKAGAYGLDGSAVSTAQVETTLHRRGPGAVEQDPEELLESAFTTVARCVERSGTGPDAVVAIAVTGQMAGILGIDRDWRPVAPYDSWLDSRCAPQLRRLAAEHGDLLVERTGCPPMLDHAPKMQWWRDERPAAYERTAAFVMPAVYVAGVLAGLSAADAFIDRTYLHFTGVADTRTATWSSELIATLNLDGRKLPRIVAPDAVIGELTPAAAARCGLRAGVPIAAGIGDTAAGTLGAGIVAPGQLLDTAGTAAVLVGAVDAFHADPEHGLIVMAGVLPGQWLPLNYIAGGGLCLPWLAGIAGGDASAAGDGTATLVKLLAEAARVAPGADGLAFVPHLEGRIAPHAPGMRGGFLGLSPLHGRAHLARAILEAVAFEYATYLRAMRRLHPGVEFSSARAIGGGARSELWNSIKADVLGVSVARLTMEETATRGAALLAAAAAGLVDDLAAVAAAAPTADAVEPDRDRHERYAALVDRYDGITGMLLEHQEILHPIERDLVR